MGNSKKAKRTLADFFRRLTAMDGAIPEELAKDAEEVAAEVDTLLTDEEPEQEQDPPAAQDNTDLAARMEKLEALLEKLLAGKAKDSETEDPAMKSLDDLESELNGEGNHLGDEGGAEDPDESGTVDETGEASVTNAPEAIKDALSVFKPMVAGIEDIKQRKSAADALSALCRMNRKTTEDYSGIAKAATKTARDAQAKQAAADEYGQKMAEKYNPHYQKEVK